MIICNYQLHSNKTINFNEMLKLTNIISNMGTTKAHMVPFASDNQQLYVSKQKQVDVFSYLKTRHLCVLLQHKYTI